MKVSQDGVRLTLYSRCGAIMSRCTFMEEAQTIYNPAQDKSNPKLKHFANKAPGKKF